MPCSVAARITAATSFGRDCIGTWLVGSVVVLALIFFAIALSRAGWIIRSFSATMNHEGLFCQAAFVTFSSKALPRIGPCVTAITLVCVAGRSCAKSFATPSGVRYRYPAGSGRMLEGVAKDFAQDLPATQTRVMAV